MTASDLPDELYQLPPSCVVAYRVLDQSDGPLTAGEIANRGPLNARTARKACSRLYRSGLVESPTSSDGRKRLYSLRSGI